MYIDEEKIEEIKERADIVDIISAYLTLNRSGSNLVGLCPFHSEKTPSFTVSSSKQFFHCFGCGESGDSITFIMKKENLDFKEAVEFLADKLGIELDGTEIDVKEIEERNNLYEMNREAGRYFHEKLLKSDSSLKYLEKRGISLNEIKRFGLGFVPDEWESLHKFLLSKDYKSEEMEEIGLISKRKNSKGYYDRFRNRIMFPIINRNNKIIGFGGRVLDDSMPKYLNSKESKVFNKGYNLYGLNLVNKYSTKKKILLVEGYMDVIALFSKGIDYSVASLGTALTPAQAKLLKRYGEDIYIAYDSDTAGTKATVRAIDIINDEGVKAKVVELPNDMDPDDYIQKMGKIRFERLLKEALNPIDYKIILNKKKYDTNNLEEKIAFTKEISKIIGALKSPIEEDVYIEKISKDTGISKEAIEKEVRGHYYKKKSARERVIKKEPDNKGTLTYNQQKGYIKAEIELIKLMIVDKEYFNIINEKIKEEYFSNKTCKELYKYIKIKYKSEDILHLDDIINSISNIELDKKAINELKNNNFEYKATNIEKIIDDLINTLIISKLEEKRTRVIKDIEEFEENPEKLRENGEYFKDLCVELININKEIKSIRNK